MSAPQLLTVEDVQAWLRVNAATHAETEARALATMVDAVLRDVLMNISWGLQAACDHAWSTRGKHATITHRHAVREALSRIGWVCEDQGATD